MSCEIGSNLPSRRSGNRCRDAISRGTSLCKRQLGAASSWGQWGPGDLSRRWQRRGTGNYNVNDVKKKHLKARSMN